MAVSWHDRQNELKIQRKLEPIIRREAEIMELEMLMGIDLLPPTEIEEQGNCDYCGDDFGHFSEYGMWICTNCQGGFSE